jgi:hypothetical protein
VVGGDGELGPEGLHDWTRLEPDVRDHAGVDPGRPLFLGERGQPLGEGGQLGVGEPGADLAHRADTWTLLDEVNMALLGFLAD